jgi:glycine/D-amino acid oxidase-like deaminating enzyme
MNNTADIVIIGGGIQGLSLAYHLGRLGMREVCLVEMHTLGSGSSGRSATIIGHAFPAEEDLWLTRRSFAALTRFREEMEADPGYEPIGCLLLAGPAEAPALRRRQALLQEMGVEGALLSGEEILRLTPGLDLDGIELALHLPHDGNIDPHSIMMAYAQQARRQGAALVEEAKATGLRLESGRVAGVETTAGPIAAPCVVNAAGFRAGEVAGWAGMSLPITNLKRHIFVTGPVAAYAQAIPFTYEVGAAWYMRREGPGLILGMGAVESDEEDPQVDWSFLDEVIEQSIRRAPPLIDAGVKTAWAGLRPVTPDDHPILGEAPHLRGFYNDCGWGGHGVMHAPAAGEAVAELIATGRSGSQDLGAYRAERFAGILVGE